jgi:hypothetical protein
MLEQSALIDFTPHALLKSWTGTNGEEHLQPVDIARISPMCTNLANVKCGFVHRSLFPGKRWKMHTADVDTLAANQIIRRLLSEMDQRGL